MASIILPPGSAPANPSEGELYYDNTSKQVKVRDNASFKALGGADLQGEPHIITKKLHPAYLGKLLDDTTSHSGNYGTEQADGRMYYYTDIAGSKPIHDPRIGVHFGSQRHKFKSLQILEQETATEKDNVYSVDGREWMRAKGPTWTAMYNSNGNFIENSSSSAATDSHFIEIVGYFNDANLLIWTSGTGNDIFGVAVNGGARQSNDLDVGASSPLNNRLVDPASLVNLTFNATPTLSINTLRISTTSGAYLSTHGIELIAQDTTSSSTKVQIQVPAQDVVSYGRKFSVSATAQHYDPFNGFSSGDANALATKVDTATSLGLAKWLHSGTYYRPYNGMRVVKWIDENGAIKTSVTCMPPNAKSIGDSSSLTNANAKANASIANNTFYPTFEAHTTSVNEDNLHELAKTFHWREFGNGAANGGAGATWADASMLTDTKDDISYVMDDGLTSLAGHDIKTHGSHPTTLLVDDANDYHYITFIGTGIGFKTTTDVDYGSNSILGQNLPYGTHILKSTRSANGTTFTLDGVDVATNTTTILWTNFLEVDFFQPKRPLIPDSACVLADYMVFADFKPQTTNGTQLISKGVRRQNISRDVFFDETDGDSFTFAASAGVAEGFQAYLSGNADSPTSFKMRIPSFGTNYVHRGFQSETRVDLFIGDTNNGGNATDDDNATTGSYAHLTSDLTLGVYQFGANATSGTNGNTSGFDIVTPVHTSHHYQSFETPYLHELIGGDRSMEQTNLICTSDGKSWDEVTRDVSYIGQEMFKPATTNSQSGSTSMVVFNKFRGTNEGSELYQKNFAIGYTRFICLRDGMYQIMASTMKNINLTYHANIKINGVRRKSGHSTSENHDTITNILTTHLKRGDYVEIEGGWYAGAAYGHFEIIRLEK